MSREREGRRRGGTTNNINAVFYAETYHPIQAGSIDGTDILPHDNAIYRALLCSNAGLYDPFGDSKAIGDPYCTLFVGHLSQLTTEVTLRKEMSRYGRVKNLRLVRDIVTGASRRYAFVEFDSEREMRRAYKDAHHTIIDDTEIMVDYNRQRLMPGWIPRRLGGGLGGKKESGQLRFGGRDRPFRAPLRQIPYDDLKRLGIPPPPEGRYMSRAQIPSPPRREKSAEQSDEFFYRHEKESQWSSPHERSGSRDHFSDLQRRSTDRGEQYQKQRSFSESGDSYSKYEKQGEHSYWHEKSATWDRSPDRQRRLTDRGERSHKRQKHSRYSHHRYKGHHSHDRSSRELNSSDDECHSHSDQHSKDAHGFERWSPRGEGSAGD